MNTRQYSNSFNMRNNIGASLPVTARVSNGQINLYCIRIQDPKKELKLEVDFGCNIRFPFKQLYKDSNYEQHVIYYCELSIMKDKEQQHLYVDHAGQVKYVEDFSVKSPQTNILSRKTFRDENNNHLNLLREYPDDEHIFLFNIRLGEDTNLITDFCLFTFYLLKNKKFYLFNVLTNQFRSTLDKENNYTFNRHDFNQFFQLCHKYFYYPSTEIDDIHQSLLIQIKTIGILSPLKKETFDRSCTAAQQFTMKIMSDLRTYLSSLLRIINQTEWNLFKTGLSILYVLEFLFDIVREENKLDLFDKIVNKQQREDLAHGILEQFALLDEAITSNNQWIDLFTMTNSEKIDIRHLNVANSFETFILCLTCISKVMIMSNNFKQKLTNYFENRIYFQNIESKKDFIHENV